jgi:MYXO-CTERM domain-containing protein
VTGTTLMCRATVKPSAEVCDGLDNDCNGQTDEMAPCPASWICDRGVCVPPCSEFCGVGYSCDGKVCVETACIGKTCDNGKVCKAGACVGPCDGVTCPKEQVCRVGRCVDPCDGVTCDTDRVCEGGVCITHCKCSSCGAGKTCDKGGRCLESGCVGKTCPSGQACVAGDCVDACAGAICPARQECRAGNCVDIPRPDAAVTPGAYDGNPGSFPDAPVGPGGGRPDAAVDGAAGAKFGPDCACTTTVPPAGRWLPIAIAAWAVFHRRRRRRAGGRV